jgi:hypothetical protein
MGSLSKRRRLFVRSRGTKAVSEVEAACDGFLYQIAEEGEYVLVNNPIFLITEKELDDVEKFLNEITKKSESKDSDGQKRWTKKAELVAKKIILI